MFQVGKFRTLLCFRVFSRDFRVPSRCRDPKGETLRLRSAKVDAPTSSPIKANLKANCDDLQVEPQAQRFSRVSDSATRWGFVCRPKARWSESPLNTSKSQKQEAPRKGRLPFSDFNQTSRNRNIKMARVVVIDARSLILAASTPVIIREPLGRALAIFTAKRLVFRRKTA